MLFILFILFIVWFSFFLQFFCALIRRNEYEYPIVLNIEYFRMRQIEGYL